MNKVASFVLFSFFFALAAWGQKIQYSRQLVPTMSVDAMQLVTNIGGNHHLVCLTVNKKPKVYIFNKLLQLTDERELELKLKENCDVRVLPVGGAYYLYIHYPESAVRNLFRIEGEGNITDVSPAIARLMDSAKVRKESAVQLVVYRNRLVFLSHTYYTDAKQIETKIAEVNSSLELQKLSFALFPFDMTKEIFQQTLLIDDGMLLLKTVKNDETGNALQIMKYEMATGDVIMNAFFSPSHLYINPNLQYNSKDSSILVHSLLREPPGSVRQQRSVFVSRLNDSLQQITPISLLTTQFKNNTATNFVFLNGVQQGWLNFANAGIRVFTNMYRSRQPTIGFPDDYNRSYWRANDPFLNYPINFNQPTAVRFTVLNEMSGKTKDTVVANSGSFYEVQPRPFAQFVFNKEAYLLLIQNFSHKKKGLLMMHAADNGELETTPLSVYDRYDYNIALAQQGTDYFILPYTHKNETGLVKVTLTN